MRLAYCYKCKVLTRIADAPPIAEIEPQADRPVDDWRQQHMHGLTEDTHPGGQIFPIDSSNLDTAGEERVIGEVSKALQDARLEVVDYVDGLKEDAVKCHRRHGQPSWPYKMCADYHDDSKRIGYAKREDRDPAQKYLCDLCPYDVAIQLEKKWRSGIR